MVPFNTQQAQYLAHAAYDYTSRFHSPSLKKLHKIIPHLTLTALISEVDL